jgi:hypothetical protein
MALLLKAAGGVEEIRPAHGRTFVLGELQAFVGGFIEVVRARDGRWLVINEDGKRLELARNLQATALYHQAGGVPWDVVVGDVLLADRIEMGEHEEAEGLARERAEDEEAVP